MQDEKGLTPQEENKIAEKQTVKAVGKEIAGELLESEAAERLLIIRHDKPKQELELRERVHFKADGNIDTVSRYLTKRAHLIDHEQTTVLVDREKMSIKITSNETDHWADKLGGKLEVHPDFIKFGINSGKTLTTQQMGDFFRMHRAFFPNESENLKLVTVLKKFEGSVDAKIKEIKENNGNQHVSREVVVSSTVPAAFSLRMGLFKGLEAKTFEVETIITVNNNGSIVVALESPEANEIIEKYKNDVIDTEIAEIEKLAPKVLIIEQ